MPALCGIAVTVLLGHAFGRVLVVYGGVAIAGLVLWGQPQRARFSRDRGLTRVFAAFV